MSNETADGASKDGPGGCAPDRSSTALLLIDVVNTFEFPEGKRLLGAALALAPTLLELKRRCRDVGIPAIYVNDHFGRWRSDFSTIVEHCVQPPSRGHEFVRQLVPAKDDYFVFKPMHSGFYQTTLSLLLDHLKVKRLILTGFSSNICVLATANDAYMRDYELCIPKDTMAACSQSEQDYAELHFEKVLKADLRKAGELGWKRLVAEFA